MLKSIPENCYWTSVNESSDNFQNRSAKFPDQKEKHRILNKTLKDGDNHILVIANLK